MFAFKDYILFHTYRDTRCEILSFLSLTGRTRHFYSRSLPILELKCEKVLICMK